MRAAVAMALCACAGCYSPTPPQNVPCVDDDHCPTSQKCIGGYCGGNGVDGGHTDDAMVDALPLCQQWHPKYFDPCSIPAPTDIDLGPTWADYSLDTDKAELKGKMNKVFAITTVVLPQSGGPDVLLVSVKDLALPAGENLTINGSRPVLFAVWGTATIAGDIDGSAALGVAGPGGSGSFCTGSVGVNGAAGSPATGGGGGGFQGAGGRGGNLGGLGGAGVGVPTLIRGGCSGGLGGAGSSSSAPRGAGGGAIQISALTSITIDGSISVGGGGGTGGRANLGGGGAGGSGGYIGLDAPALTINGTLAANGGSGGGGASDVAAGLNGTDGRTSTAPAVGGPGAGTSNIGPCGPGGNGSVTTTLTGGNGGTSICGGGGAGGGAGFIVLWSASPTIDSGAVITPPEVAGP